MVEIDDKTVQYGEVFGKISQDNKFWDDNDNLKHEIMNYKIINIKIYFNSGQKNNNDNKDENGLLIEPEENKENEEDKILTEEKYIIGLSVTYKNLYNGEIKEIEHKGTDIISGMKELKINGNEYLKRFNINFKNDFHRISQIGFCTNRNNQISVGIKDGEDKIEEKNDEDNVIVGCFGHFLDKINALGCIYISKKIYVEKLLIGFFLLRKNAMNNIKFKDEWDKKFKELDITYQYMWKTVNLPDAPFYKIISLCFL